MVAFAPRYRPTWKDGAVPGAAAELCTEFAMPTLRPAMPVPGTVRLEMLSSGGVTVRMPVVAVLFDSNASTMALVGSAVTRTRYCPAATVDGMCTVELVASVPPADSTTAVRVGPIGMSGSPETGTRVKSTLNGDDAAPRFLRV